MKSKMFLLIFFASLVWVMSCTKEEAESKSECKGIITTHLDVTERDHVYSVTFDITNAGNKRINSVKIAFAITLSNGFIDKRTASYPIINIMPGETMNGVRTVINPPNTNPANPVWIHFEGDIVNVKFSDPEIVCAQ
jgi:hypothetical protein